VAVAAVQLMPIGFHVMAEADLAVVFGRATAVVTVSLATSALLDLRPWQFWLTGMTALVAFLSDAVSLASLAATLAAIALLLIVGWWLSVWAWLLATSVLVAVAAFGGRAVRYVYAAAPPAAVFAAIGVVTLWDAGGQRRALAVLSSALGVVIGVIGWLRVLSP